MVVDLCLMASQGHLPGVVLPPEQGMSKVIQDQQSLLPLNGARHQMVKLGSLKLNPRQHEDPWRPVTCLSDYNQRFVAKNSMLTDVEVADSVHLTYGIEHSIRLGKILNLLMSGGPLREGMNMSFLADMMWLQSLRIDWHQQPQAPLFPTSELYSKRLLLDFMDDLITSSRIAVHPDGRLLYNVTGTEMKDLLSAVNEFYLYKNSYASKKLSVLVPNYNRLESIEVGFDNNGSSKMLQVATFAPVKSPEKTKVKPSPKKKNVKKVGRERDLYKRNYFHACESLLSLMVDKKKHGKTAILSLKKSGPELPDLLTQFSAGIAGTGLAVLFSIACKMACGRVPFCASKLFNTGLGFGLVWLSWAVNNLRDTIVYVSKKAGKLDKKEVEMMERVDNSVKNIYFSAATIMAIAVLRLA